MDALLCHIFIMKGFVHSIYHSLCVQSLQVLNLIFCHSPPLQQLAHIGLQHVLQIEIQQNHTRRIGHRYITTKKQMVRLKVIFSWNKLYYLNDIFAKSVGEVLLTPMIIVMFGYRLLQHEQIWDQASLQVYITVCFHLVVWVGFPQLNSLVVLLQADQNTEGTRRHTLLQTEQLQLLTVRDGQK